MFILLSWPQFFISRYGSDFFFESDSGFILLGLRDILGVDPVLLDLYCFFFFYDILN